MKGTWLFASSFQINKFSNVCFLHFNWKSYNNLFEREVTSLLKCKQNKENAFISKSWNKNCFNLYNTLCRWYFGLNFPLPCVCVLSAGQWYTSRSMMWMSLLPCFESHSTELLWQKERFMTASCKSRPQIRTVHHSTVRSATTRSPPLTRLLL